MPHGSCCIRRSWPGRSYCTLRRYTPISYMLCLNAELAPKHYLLQQGMLETDFRKIGNHDLTALFAIAREKGLILQIQDAQALVVMQKAHSGPRFSFSIWF